MPNISPETSRILDDVARQAAAPLPSAHGLPPEAYRSEELLALEQERVFARDWICPGLAAEIPNAGDYLTYSIGDQPVFCIRDRSGDIRTFSNVCLHRMTQLLEGRGRAGRVVCPYHAWTYDHSGQLISAKYMGHTEGFDKQAYCLPEIRTEIWQGWIYITLNEDAPPIAEVLAPLAEDTSRYRMEGYVPAVQQDHVWDTNWKLLTENFMEGYHLPVAHKNTVGAWFPAKDTRFFDETYDGFTCQSFVKSGDAKYGVAHPDNRALEGHWRNTSLLPTIYPAHMYVLAPDHLWYLSLRPKGVGQVMVRFGVALAPEVDAALDDRAAFIDKLAVFFDTVNAEDRGVVEGLYRGIQAPLARSGPLSWLEREIHDFTKYLNARLRPDTNSKLEAAQ